MSKVIGIDLGTTFSAIASLDDMGNPEVIPSIEENRKIKLQQFMLMDQMLLLVTRH